MDSSSDDNYDFPLRWKSIGEEQWWYASPIDLAAANGLYDLVVELLHLDTNLLIKLTSLRRIRRLETVWEEDNEGAAHLKDVAKCRSHVAKNLMLECEIHHHGSGHNSNNSYKDKDKDKEKENSLIRAGYGGWLLYTAASAGDVGFVQELLGRDPFLVFGEGEYGVTDILYAAARGNNCEVFKLLLDSAISHSIDADLDDEDNEESVEIFKRDMMNRAIHAAARGGNWEILKQLFGNNASDILAFRDSQGCTILHTAAGRGQVEVVRNLLASCDIINMTDSQGNTALHVASYRGYLPVVEILILESPSLALLTNHHGDTFLHMAVAGFRSPGFRRLDKHTELMKQLVSEKIVKLDDIINTRNNDGRTALHLSVIDNNNIQCEVVELLISAASIDLNIEDSDGMTPLDILKQRPKSASSEILIKRLISAGGRSSSSHRDYNDRTNSHALFANAKTHGIGSSPGTSFRIPDSEIFMYTSMDNDAKDADYDKVSVESNSSSDEISNDVSVNSPYNNNIKTSYANHAARRLKFLLRWPRRRETKASASELEDDGESFDHFSSSRNLQEFPISLRQKHSQQQQQQQQQPPPFSLPNNKGTQSMRTYNNNNSNINLSSPSSKMKFLMQGVIQVKPHSTPTSPFHDLSLASLSCANKQKGVGAIMRTTPSCSKDNGTLHYWNYKQHGSFNKKLMMNKYFSFGAQGQIVEDSNTCTRSNRSCKPFNSLVA